ncbi:f0de2a74-6287-4d05-9b4d-39abd1e42738 [Sclerotinia trifoliorum]|uniref:F0de2a74-6287-4d05-9b4d-39abd1e42738 n=1 Tax=Sclerotinia trifoliorum TaxID=28548 RepID=A0A8H2W3P6_9HELO|nr:f0de2a74-6287-4d05-9b4d-39abd1e42738 [Sclerotinia trifoliorum]
MTSLGPASSSSSSSQIPESPAHQQARTYLHSLLSKTLLIHTTDNRMFRGSFKCTDSDLNIILSETYEYRIPPSPSTLISQPPSSTSAQPASSTSSVNPSTSTSQNPPSAPILNITPRWLGLVVVPGKHIVRIELEEFESQVRGRKTTTATTTSDSLAKVNALAQDLLIKGKEKEISI